MKKILIGIMVSLFLTGILQVSTMAAENTVKTIEEFQPLAESEQKFHINKEGKPKLVELISAMPKTLSVLTDEGKWEELQVQWYCVGDDYETSDSYYFQFSPLWNEEEYAVKSGFEVIKDAPYVSVFLYDDVMDASVTGNSNETTIYNFLVNNMGLNSAAACGVLANIQAESGFNPNALGDSGTSYGICQWHSARWDAMKNWCNNNGHNWQTITGQLNYLKFELSANNSAYLWNGKTIFNYLASVSNNAQGAYDAGYYWCFYFEVPANKETKSVTRGNTAKNTYWPVYSGSISDEITISGQNAPGTISVGNVFSISGTVSSGKALTNVTAGVYDFNGNMKTGKSAAPNATSYNLKGLDPYVYFNHLEAGVYYYRVTASNASRTATLVEQPFIVLGNSATVSDGRYKLASVDSSAYVIDVAGHTNEKGGNLQLEANNNTEYQVFEITHIGGGYYNLRNSGSGIYADVCNAEARNGANVQQHEKNGSTAQNWQILPTGAGYCLVPQCATSYCLDIQDGMFAAGTNIRLWDPNLSAAQRFQLIPAQQSSIEITYNANGGTGAPSSQTTTAGTSITLSSEIPRYSWSNFMGWSTSSTATVAEYLPGDIYTADESVTLYAVWEKIVITDIGAGIAKETMIDYPGQSILYQFIPSETAEYRIRSMQGDGEGLDTKMYLCNVNGKIIAEDDDSGENRNFELTYSMEAGVTYYIKVYLYSDNQIGSFYTGIYRKYQVDYNVNGGNETIASEDFYSYYYTEDLVWSDTEIPTREGYTFVEWNTKRDGSGVAYDLDNLTFSFVTTIAQEGKIKLHAIWEKDDVYTNPFSDISGKEWYASAVQYVNERGIMNGNNGLFNPLKDVTRAHLVITLYNLEGRPVVMDFRACQELKDVKKGQWYTDAVCWAYNTGVAVGNDATKMFNMNTPVTRQQLAMMLYNYAGYRGLDTKISADISGMKGANEVASYAKTAMKWAVGSGIISGSKTVVNGTAVYDLKPTGTATRAQLASILQNFCKNNNL